VSVPVSRPLSPPGLARRILLAGVQAPGPRGAHGEGNGCYVWPLRGVSSASRPRRLGVGARQDRGMAESRGKPGRSPIRTPRRSTRSTRPTAGGVLAGPGGDADPSLLPGSKGRLLLDVGASHHEKDSTTYYLERHLDWHGIAIKHPRGMSGRLPALSPADAILRGLLDESGRPADDYFVRTADARILLRKPRPCTA